MDVNCPYKKCELPLTTSTKKRNGAYCCVIHEAKYIVDILCTVIALIDNEINLYMKKCFFPNL